MSMTPQDIDSQTGGYSDPQGTLATVVMLWQLIYETFGCLFMLLVPTALIALVVALIFVF